MIFMLQNVNDGNVFYLIGKKQFLVGRKDCDLLIQNDGSISRKHAIIHVKGDKVTVEDCGSKYRTTYKGEALEPNVEREWSLENNIHFGVCNSLYSLKKFEFITTGTLLNSNIKKQLIRDLSTLRGKYIDQWTPECTHLTVEEITLTIKVLHALIDEKPIVKPEYWTKFVERVQKNLPPPNIELYNKPPVAEALINKIDFKPNPQRKHLFNGKLFIFPIDKDKKKMEDIIKKTGGTSISWEKNPMPLQDIKLSPKEFLIVQTTETINDPTLNKVIEEFSKQGKRTIPLQEIPMSIVSCSCEKDCNPNFDRIEQVFKIPGPSEPSQSNALAENTQSQYFSLRQFKSERKDEKSVIPDTFECKLGETESFDMSDLNSEVVFKKESSQSLKRLNKDDLQGTPVKKTKVMKNVENKVEREQNDDFVVKKSSKRTIDEDDIPHKHKENESNPKVNAFDFLKRTKINKSQTGSKDHPFKIIKRENENVHGINKENPFAPRTKKRTSSESPPSSASLKKKKSGSSENIFCDSIAESSKIKHDISGTWKSKNTTDIVEGTKEEFEHYLDVEMKKFAEQFKDVVVVEILDMDKIIKKPNLLRNPFSGSNGTQGKVNFKMFKKVMPLRPQTTVIGRNSFHAVLPGETTQISDSRREFHNSDDEIEPSLKTGKKLPKKFLI